MSAAIRRVAGGRAHHDKSGAFEISDQTLGYETRHQLGGVMRSPASVVTQRVHQDFGHVRGAGRDQIIAGVHQKTP
ncbi:MULTISPECIES: hypothetical protein [unclassified Gluconobacter]|uniref:hypothetical protein n=1 Tax=unclassified Gluconobacter TaxID=2644261 RepID=UPI001C04B932|nr:MULTISPECIES: hypothetical protein [unclassified Gluconobacter]